jgi:hypothetical protein
VEKQVTWQRGQGGLGKEAVRAGNVLTNVSLLSVVQLAATAHRVAECGECWPPPVVCGPVVRQFLCAVQADQAAIVVLVA